MSKIHDNSLLRALKYSNTLRADDPRFNQTANVTHEDGSVFYLKCAFTMDDPEQPEWVWIITEHFGVMVFDKSDLMTWEVLPLDHGSRSARCSASSGT